MAPRLPVIQAKPLRKGDLFGGGLYGSGTIDPTRTGTDPALVRRLKGQLQPFNPDSVAAAIDLAAMFVPGPKGMRAVGPLTPGQKVLLERLNNVKGGGPQQPLRKDLSPEHLAEFNEFWANSRRPYRFTDSQTTMAPPLHPSLGDIKDLADVFGLPRGQPYFAHRLDQRQLPGGVEAMASRLGQNEGGVVPSWVTTASERRIWERFRHDPSHLAALAGMKDDVRAALAQIIDTINRRPPPGTGGLSGYGAN